MNLGCFLNVHNWNPWGEMKSTIITRFVDRIGNVSFPQGAEITLHKDTQERTCINCGEIQRREVV